MKIFTHEETKIVKNDKNELTAHKIWKDLVDKKEAEMRYFCPLCRTLFDSLDCHIMKWDGNIQVHFCMACKEEFIPDDYAEQRKNGLNYKLCSGGNKDAINKFIKEAVLELGRQGFSVEEIYSITHFSRVKICKIISKIKPSVETYSIKEFFMSKLEATRYAYEELLAIMKKHKKNDADKKLVKGFLDKAINLGCNYDAISILFEQELKENQDKLLELCTRRKTQIIKIKPKRSLPVA